jgi:hypothetical protein
MQSFSASNFHISGRTQRVMKLETEFRVRLQLRQLEQQFSDSSSTSETEFTASTWVELVYLPSAVSFNQALLLCQCSGNQWLAWIPDYGEILLYTDEFRQVEI